MQPGCVVHASRENVSHATGAPRHVVLGSQVQPVFVRHTASSVTSAQRVAAPSHAEPVHMHPVPPAMHSSRERIAHAMAKPTHWVIWHPMTVSHVAVVSVAHSVGVPTHSRVPASGRAASNPAPASIGATPASEPASDIGASSSPQPGAKTSAPTSAKPAEILESEVMG